MFLVLSKICDSSSTDSRKVSSFRFLSCLWSNILVEYIIALSLITISLSFDFCLRLLINNKSGVSHDFNKSKKVECYW